MRGSVVMAGAGRTANAVRNVWRNGTQPLGKDAQQARQHTGCSIRFNRVRKGEMGWTEKG